jgi:hypothetical protein
LGSAVENNLMAGGILISIGCGKVLSFWHGVLIGGALLFLVAFLLLWVDLFCDNSPTIEGGK